MARSWRFPFIARPIVAAMPVMHEKMHERAGEQRQPDECTEHMRPMFGEQEGTGDDGKSENSAAREIRKLPCGFSPSECSCVDIDGSRCPRNAPPAYLIPLLGGCI